MTSNKTTSKKVLLNTTQTVDLAKAADESDHSFRFIVYVTYVAFLSVSHSVVRDRKKTERKGALTSHYPTRRRVRAVLKLQYLCFK